MKYKTKDIQLSVNDFHNKNHTQIVAEFLKIKKDAISNVSVFKKSVDARRKSNVHYVVSFVFEFGYSKFGSDIKWNADSHQKIGVSFFTL